MNKLLIKDVEFQIHKLANPFAPYWVPSKLPSSCALITTTEYLSGNELLLILKLKELKNLHLDRTAKEILLKLYPGANESNIDDKVKKSNMFFSTDDTKVLFCDSDDEYSIFKSRDLILPGTGVTFKHLENKIATEIKGFAVAWYNINLTKETVKIYILDDTERHVCCLTYLC